MIVFIFGLAKHAWIDPKGDLSAHFYFAGKRRGDEKNRNLADFDESVNNM